MDEKKKDNNKPSDESHLSGYNWCGPGTNVQQRLANKIKE